MTDVNQFNCTCGVVTEPKQGANNKLCRFRAVITDYRGDKQFLTVKAWDKIGDLLFKYLKVGRKVFLTGRLTFADEWTNSEGKTTIDTILTVETFNFLESGNSNGNNSDNGKKVSKTSKEEVGVSIDSDDDIPF